MAPDVIGPYRLTAELGSGGMGTVHRAVALAGAAVPEGTTVALKVIHRRLLADPAFLQRFRREAELGRRIRHENVVRTLEVGHLASDAGEVHWIALEFVEGRDLRALLEEGGPAPEGLVRHVGREIARALGAIHAAGVVHRDLKPENVLLAGDAVVKVTDLGVARPVETASRLSETGAFVGSLQYAAPEQFGTSAGPAQARTDLHALGLLLYELATGRHPYAGADVAAALDRLRAGRRRRAAEANPRITPFLDAVIETLLATRPEDRFVDAATVEEVLTRGEDSPWWEERRRALPAARRDARIPVERETAFVGREAALDRLEARWREARAGSGASVLVEGEEGVGKTRLLDAFLARVAERGEDADVIYARHAGAQADPGVGAVGAALAARLGPLDLEAALRPLLPESARVVPSLAAHLRGEPPPAAAEPLARDAVATLLLRALRSLAQARPVVLVVDDLHRASPEGLALFVALALGAPGHRILVAGAAAGGAHEPVVADLVRRGALERVPLPRLGAKDLLRLVGEALGSQALAEELLARIAGATDGNPYFALEILRDLERRGLLARGADGRRTPTAAIRELRVPPSVSDLVRARLARLEPADRDLLDAAACAGAEFDPLRVADALGEARLPVLRRLARVERDHGLVRSVGARCAFDPPQVRDAIHEGMPEWLRRATHAALAAGLAREAGPAGPTGEDAVQACLHRALGGDGAGAAALLPRALERLEPRHEHRRAADLERLLLDAPGALEGPARLAALLRAASRLHRLGQAPEEAARLREALALVDAPGSGLPRADARIRLARHLTATGALEEAKGLLAEALEVARAAGDRRAEVVALGHLGEVATAESDYALARRLQERRLALARGAGWATEETGAVAALALVAIETGRYEDARSLLAEQRRAALRDGDLWNEAAAEGNLGIVEAALGRNEEALAHDARQLELNRAIGNRRGEAIATGNLAGALFDLGRTAEALERYEHYLLLARETGSRADEAVAHVNLGSIHLVLRDVGRARTHFAASLALARETGTRRVEGYVLEGLGEAEVAAGDLEAAERWLTEALALRREIGYPRGVADTSTALAWVYLRTGRGEAARAALDEADRLNETLRIPVQRASSEVHRAWLPGEDPARARGVLREESAALPLYAQVEAWERLAARTGDPEDRARARGLLERLAAYAPAEARGRLLAAR